MSERKNRKTQAIVKVAERQLAPSGMSLAGFLSKLPNWALIPSMVALFGLLVTDAVVVDPLPFVDEAAMLWALISGMRVLGARRREAKLTRQAEELDLDEIEAMDDFEIDVEFEPASAPAPLSPLRPARQRI